ncbi:hypothetical protein J1N35_018622 [Gossypium stocksii]|uniref:Uncharacterized protein n=1 Tax=Gossypium stocksii TaxID=47602 RepID=A0A9D3VQW3_9ROSI|nr:hypothetical protein J1N35_018622 [Gossypium stocksii]
MEFNGKQNCENFLSGTLEVPSASLGPVSAHEPEVTVATPATGGSNFEAGVDTLTQSMLGVLERFFQTMLERFKVLEKGKCTECECNGHNKARDKRGHSSSSLKPCSTKRARFQKGNASGSGATVHLLQRKIWGGFWATRATTLVCAAHKQSTRPCVVMGIR